MNTHAVQLRNMIGAVLIAIGITLSPLAVIPVNAAAAALYFAPSSVSVQNGGQFTIQVRANGADFNAAQVDIEYDASKLSYISYSTSNSVLPSVAVSSNNSGLVKISQFVIGSVTGDNQLITSFTFKALSGSTTTQLTLAGSSSLQSNGTGIAGGGAKAAITLVSPTQPAPAPTQPAPTSPTKTPTSPTPQATPKPSQQTTTPSPSTPQSQTTQDTEQSPTTEPSTTTEISGPKIKAMGALGYVNDEIQVKIVTDKPSKAVVRYGTSKDKLLSSASSGESATTYFVPLGEVSKAATEGKTLYYSAEVIDNEGNKTTSEIQELSTSPVSVTLKVKDASGKVLGYTTVLVNGRQYTTDADGVVTVNGLYPGLVTVAYMQGQSTDAISLGEVDASSGESSQVFEISPTGAKKINGSAHLLFIGAIGATILATLAAGLIFARRSSRSRYAYAYPQSNQVYVDGQSSTPAPTQPPQHYNPQTVIEPSQEGVVVKPLDVRDDSNDSLRRP